jgi:two-component system, cell cycle sensor histidine kinase and response regulator CckA
VANPRQVQPHDDRSPSAPDHLRAPGDPTGEQAGPLTHDVNDLLTAILGHAQVALSEPGLPEGARSDIEAIARAARQAALLTRRLVVLHRPDVGHRTEMDLRSVVDAMAAMLRPMIGDGIDLRVERGVRSIRVVEDPVDLEAVVLNLAINARDAMPDGGTLTFGSAVLPGAGGRRAGIWVSDTGCGMDAATRARAFEPYFTTKSAGRGTGLGLASVAAMVRRNGWTILVDSTPGEGSRFTVTIPLPPRNHDPG